MVDGSLQHSFIHSFLSKGRLLYTHDETIAALCERLKDVGRRDTELQLFRAASHALAPIDKARKWFVTRRDLDYSALWILYAATPLAQIEVISRRLVPDREVIPQAATLNPSFFKVIYTGLLNAPKTPEAVGGALDLIDAYLAERAPDAVPARPRPSARGRRGAIVEGSRGSLHAPHEPERRHHRLRVPRGPGDARQGLGAGAAHETQQRRGAGAGVLLHRRRAGKR